ncbi:unnamed protein product [Paramecium pentaurelia]|uniref:Transmembrane protein n=1 Tax=Paramecium pentaurelia TaxID=43138 RepID=A0A8S1VUU9_9CILI|nr:unnamed protein product [Paramecium pentaurelia]
MLITLMQICDDKFYIFTIQNQQCQQIKSDQNDYPIRVSVIFCFKMWRKINCQLILYVLISVAMDFLSINMKCDKGNRRRWIFFILQYEGFISMYKLGRIIKFMYIYQSF